MTTPKKMLAEYEMVDCASAEGRPVWKHTSRNAYLFYASDEHWYIYNKYNQSSGWIHSSEARITEIPRNGWKVYNSTINAFVSDPEMTTCNLE